MITDEERRDVAERLRILASHAPTDKDYVLDALGLYPGEYIDGFDPYCVNELADLIDRPTCNDVSDFDHESFKCSRCGYRVLSIDGSSEAAKLVAPEGGVIDFGYCPNCGAEVVEE